jgi:3-phenylpropionate/trans-cinnamate dioxygenase alpha subunit
MQMGIGNEQYREDGIPGITNHVFSETAARGLYRHWANLLMHEKWEEVERADEAYEQGLLSQSAKTDEKELMK